MKKTLFCILSLLVLFQSSAQKYGNIWQFGNNIGLDFNGCEPTVISGGNSGFEGCSSISNEEGQLLFYTNSDTVWNSNHNMMPNGKINSTNGTLSQVLIISKPQSLTNYYVITTQIQGGGSLNLQYHEIDMSLDGGLGDVLNSTSLVSNMNITEQVAATLHNNGSDIWLLTHEYGTNKFLAFLVTNSGIISSPIETLIGPTHVSSTSNFNARGEIKISPDGTKIAYNGNGEGGNDLTNILCLLDFDNTTGALSNPISLPYSRGEFGLSFSPDNSKLYGSTWKAFGFNSSDYNYLYQFDLSSNDSLTIVNSKKIIDSMQVPKSYGSLKIAPDGKIYVRYTNTDYLGVINDPNQLGNLCNYNKEGLFIGNQTYQYGLNNYIEYTSYCDELSIQEIKSEDKNRNLIKIIDITGRETHYRPNTLLIYIYDDGSKKKVFKSE